MHWRRKWQPTPVFLPGEFQGRRSLVANPRTEPKFPALQVDSLAAEPPGKPKNTGVGSLSILQWVLLIQELNWGLLHCRRILYQLSYQGGPYRLKTFKCTFLAMTYFLPTQGFYFFHVNGFLKLKIFYPKLFTICIYVCTYMGLPW